MAIAAGNAVACFVRTFPFFLTRTLEPDPPASAAPALDTYVLFAPPRRPLASPEPLRLPLHDRRPWLARLDRRGGPPSRPHLYGLDSQRAQSLLVRHARRLSGHRRRDSRCRPPLAVVAAFSSCQTGPPSRAWQVSRPRSTSRLDRSHFRARGVGRAPPRSLAARARERLWARRGALERLRPAPRARVRGAKLEQGEGSRRAGLVRWSSGGRRGRGVLPPDHCQRPESVRRSSFPRDFSCSSTPS